MKTIGIQDSIHKRIRLLCAMTNKKIYELIAEAVEYLETKYSATSLQDNKDRK